MTRSPRRVLKLRHIHPARVASVKGEPCAYCLSVATPPRPGTPHCHSRARAHRLSLTVDHIVPFAAGGRDTWENRTAACFACNSAKGTTGALLFMVARGFGSRVTGGGYA